MSESILIESLSGRWKWIFSLSLLWPLKRSWRREDLHQFFSCLLLYFPHDVLPRRTSTGFDESVSFILRWERKEKARTTVVTSANKEVHSLPLNLSGLPLAIIYLHTFESILLSSATCTNACIPHKWRPNDDKITIRAQLTFNDRNLIFFWEEILFQKRKRLRR